MDVTDILRDRMREPAGLQRMTAISVVMHAALVATVIFMPGGLLSRAVEAPRTVMTISLGGSGEGARSSGMTSIGGRPVQTAEPAEKREAVRPPAAKAPEMTIPKPNARPTKATPPPTVAQAPDEARGRTLARGKEVAPGSAVADTGVRGQGFGLSTGGGAGSGSYLDVANFCCPDYLVTMIERIRANWIHQMGIPGNVVVKFTINRDGSITDVVSEKSSGTATLDLSAQRALAVTKTLPPLPAQFPNPTLTVHLNFQFQ
ncbi:MAG TPA: TonB family protein [Vicinamibacterales bacterium]|jgi:TonB family protein